MLGLHVGCSDGCVDGKEVGWPLGSHVGCSDGFIVGCIDGLLDG